MISKLEWVPKMVNILRDPVCKKISFTVGSLKVTPELLDAAAKAFEGFRVPIIFDPNNVADKDGAEASYSPTLRVVFVHNENIDDQIVKGSFLHEAAHMIHHERGLQKVLKTESEVVSYMAQAMFYHLKDWDRNTLISSQVRSSLDTVGTPAEIEIANAGIKKIVDTAWDLAELLFGKKIPGKPWPPDRKPIDNDSMAKEYHVLIEKLRAAIKANPLYKSDVGVVLNYTAF